MPELLLSLPPQNKQPAGSCRNLPDPAGTCRILQELVGTCWNLPELAGTCRNLRNLPEPAGTLSSQSGRVGCDHFFFAVP